MDCNSKLIKGRRSHSSPLSSNSSSYFSNRDPWYRNSLRKNLLPSNYQSFNKNDFLNSKSLQDDLKNLESSKFSIKSEPSTRTSVISYSGSGNGLFQKQIPECFSIPQRPISTSLLDSQSYLHQTAPTLARRHSLNIISSDVEMPESNFKFLKEPSDDKYAILSSLDKSHLNKPGSAPILSEIPKQNQNAASNIYHMTASSSNSSTSDTKNFQIKFQCHQQFDKKLSNLENNSCINGHQTIITSLHDVTMDSLVSNSSFLGVTSVSSCSSASSKLGKNLASIVHLPYDQLSSHSLLDIRSSKLHWMVICLNYFCFLLLHLISCIFYISCIISI